MSSSSASNIEQRSSEFVVEVLELLGQVLPNDPGSYSLDVSAVSERRTVTVTVDRIDLCVDGDPLLGLYINYRLQLRDTYPEVLAVESSTFKVTIAKGGTRRTPLFTVDYLREPRSAVPMSHYNIHAERGDMVWAMASAGYSHRAKDRRKQLEADRKVPRLGDLHFPTGGPRFRPCLEDVLEFAMAEFGIDTCDTARAAIHDGRARWRRLQLRAAVADDPTTAIETLRELGLSVGDEARSASIPCRIERVTAY